MYQKSYEAIYRSKAIEIRLPQDKSRQSSFFKQLMLHIDITKKSLFSVIYPSAEMFYRLSLLFWAASLSP
jgi:hypothetical protein